MPKMSGRERSQRQRRDPITHPGYECPVGRQYGKHSIWEPDARESSAAAAECPALACATCSGLRLTVASAAAGCFRMAVLSRPDIVSWSVTKLGHWDVRSPEQIFGRYALPASGALLDVGSNLGWFSWLFAQGGRRVYAVEAFPTNQRAYRTTLCLNPAWNGSVTLAATAVGGPDAAGPCVVSGSAGDNAGNGVLRCGRAEGCEAARAGGLACEPATLTTLDSLLERWGDPRFAVVKMDVEGDARARPAQGR
uniref:Methyltransferase FkbM domain-containing protein n=1 Tax=Emiliania huxleyi TaxID=2903 RepID=A0A7S3WEF2_EMIHU